MFVNRVLKLVCSPWCVACVYFIVATAYLWPFLMHPAFNLIDDGWSLTVGHTLTHSFSLSTWKSLLIETQIGRFRPIYYLYFVGMYALFSVHPFFYWVGQVLVLFGILVFLWLLISRLTRDTLLSRILPFLFLLYPTTVENMNRLGTPEPREFLFELIFFFWFLQFLKIPKKTFTQLILGISLFLVALFSKETSLALLPMIVIVYVLHWFSQHKINRVECTHLLLFSCLTLLFGVLISHPSGYTSSYHLNLSAMVKTILLIRLQQAEMFWPLTIIMTLTVIRLFTKPRVISHFIWPAAFLVGVFVNIVLLLPWQYAQLDRYYFIPLGLLLLYVGVELNLFFHNFKLRSSTFPIIFIFFVVMNIAIKLVVFRHAGTHFQSFFDRSLQTQLHFYQEYQQSYALIIFLLQIAQNGDTIYVGDHDYERIYEVGLYASHFREKNVRIMTENASLVHDYGGAYILAMLPLTNQFAQCTQTCFFVYRPAFYTPKTVGQLPLGSSYTGEEWHIIEHE